MAKPVHHSCHLLFLILFLSIHLSKQLPPPLQSQSLQKIQQLLNYPQFLSSINNTADICNIEPTPSLTIACYEDNITQLHIIGNTGAPAPPLPQYFSTDSFFASLVTLSSLKVLSLVSLGLWGPLPTSIGQLSSLEILNVSSNYFNGSIPVQVSSLKSLQTLILDHNMFTGEVPGWLSSLPVLAVLNLKNNSFSGSLPNSITSLETLRVLDFSRNHLFGEVPDLQRLKNLQVLDLEDNYFGPHFPSLHNKLVTLVLRNNRFQFGIPAELGSYYQLQKLDISFNGFVGPFLPSLLSLPSISYLTIARNKLTGMLFENTSCNAELDFVDISSNLLIGYLPTCLELKSNNRVVLYSRNCLSNEEQKQHAWIFCHNEALAVKISPDEQKQKRPYGKAVLASSTAGGIFGGIAVVGLVVLLIKRVYSKDAVKTLPTRLKMENVSAVYTVKLLSDARYISQTMKLGASLPTYRTFSLEELKEAANNFDASSVMGVGSHGQIYRGKFSDGTLVAIRSLEMKKRHSPHTYTHHIELISKLRHSYLTSALGHCFECYQDDSSVSRIFLVYEFVPNGTLRDCISVSLTGSPGQSLTWTQRIAAAIGVAKGIQFLHTGIVPGVFLNNLKITDVLMDHNLHVKISSYNLPLLTENKDRVGSLVSSPGLKESLQARAKHGDKNDVYDIGVILLEIIMGRPVKSQNEVVVMKDLLQVSITIDAIARTNIIDPAVHKECSDESLKTMMDICIRCLSNEPTDRPSVEGVLWNLQFAAQVQDQWKGDCQNNEEHPVSSSQEM